MVQEHQDNSKLSAGLSKSKARDLSPAFNRIMYVLFIALAIYYVVRSEWMTAASNMGIALIFDPFNQETKWQARPLYQKVWLIVHISIVFIFFGLFFATKP